MHKLQELFVRTMPDESIYHERLQRELQLIDKFNFTSLFERMVEILKLAYGVPHIVRGSASCSLVCYLLGISEIDPIKHNISLARFMNDHRPDIPDIDIDFPYDKRDKIIEKIYDKWPTQVARISNKIIYHKSSAIREAMRRYGYKTHIPRKFDIKELMPTKYKKVLNLAIKLHGQQSHYSLHCGGIVFYEHGVPRDMLIGYNQVCLDRNDVEKQKLLKIDLLCNRGLAQITDIDKRPLTEYPDGDPKIAELFSNGDVLGLTFAESPTFRKVAKAAQPKNISELAVALALIRPAAASRGKKATFLQQWNEDRSMNQIVFEDDAIQKIQKLLNCTEDEADYYRRAFAKNNKKLIVEFRHKLTHIDNIDNIIEELSHIRMYSFCKSHAMSYAYLVWALAYHKVYNNHKFWQATLNHCQSMYRPWVYAQEAKQAGLHIQFGKPKWSLVGDKLVKHEKQLLLFERSSKEEYLKHGYWCGRQTPSNLHIKYEEADWVKFRGMIACHRKMKDVTFATIGTCDGEYLDLILDGKQDLHGIDIISGQGEIYNMHNNKTVNVYKFKLENV